jgi:hypothetical protein
MPGRHHLRCFLRRFPRTSSGRNDLSDPIHYDLAAVRFLWPVLGRQVVLLHSLPHYACYIRFTFFAAASVLTVLAVLLARFDFGIEALLLIVLLGFPSFTRLLAIMFYCTVEGLISLYFRVRSTRHRESPEGTPMKFSLINVVESAGLFVSGYWIQNHIGTIASASEIARATEAANSNKIDVAVVAEIPSPCAALGYWANLPRLDVDP